MPALMTWCMREASLKSGSLAEPANSRKSRHRVRSVSRSGTWPLCAAPRHEASISARCMKPFWPVQRWRYSQPEIGSRCLPWRLSGSRELYSELSPT
eukprot:8484889-Alexandrium_andersonii.AAC.1